MKKKKSKWDIACSDKKFIDVASIVESLGGDKDTVAKLRRVAKEKVKHHKCPFDKAIRCYSDYLCAGCETSAEWFAANNTSGKQNVLIIHTCAECKHHSRENIHNLGNVSICNLRCKVVTEGEKEYPPSGTNWYSPIPNWCPLLKKGAK
jgi:hypothetical protein